MNKQEIIRALKAHGFSDKQIEHRRGGIYVLAEKRVPVYEFDYHEFVGMFDGKLDTKKVHFLDPWTFSIECE